MRPSPERAAAKRATVKPADKKEILTKAVLAGGKVVVTDDIREAVRDADVLYTDVWVSMGKEDEAEDRVKALAGYQINAEVVARAKPDAMVMHCLPAYRGKEIDEKTFEANAETIFTQAENRTAFIRRIFD